MGLGWCVNRAASSAVMGWTDRALERSPLAETGRSANESECALIPIMARSTRPNTLTQDRLFIPKSILQRMVGPYIRVIRRRIKRSFCAAAIRSNVSLLIGERKLGMVSANDCFWPKFAVRHSGSLKAERVTSRRL
jgi:hypothetical protein